MKLGRYVLWGAVLIGLYIVVENATGASNVTKSAASGATSLVQAFQGR